MIAIVFWLSGLLFTWGFVSAACQIREEEIDWKLRSQIFSLWPIALGVCVAAIAMEEEVNND